MAKSVEAAVSQPISTCPGCGGAHENNTLRIPSDPGPDRRWYAYAHCDACQTLTLTLDAPRHLTLWSANGFRRAAERAGWRIARTTFDAKPRSIYASEGRLRGLSEHRDDVRSAFTKAEHRQFGAEIRRMNRAGVSDTAAFYLTQL